MNEKQYNLYQTTLLNIVHAAWWVEKGLKSIKNWYDRQIEEGISCIRERGAGEFFLWEYLLQTYFNKVESIDRVAKGVKKHIDVLNNCFPCCNMLLS